VLPIFCCRSVIGAPHTVARGRPVRHRAVSVFLTLRAVDNSRQRRELCPCANVAFALELSFNSAWKTMSICIVRALLLRIFVKY
jgi:hypothetical protein